MLGSTGETIRAEGFDRDNTTIAVDRCIGDQSLFVFSSTVSQDEVEAILTGADPPGNVADLDAALDRERNRNVTTSVRWVPEERFVVCG